MDRTQVGETSTLVLGDTNCSQFLFHTPQQLRVRFRFDLFRPIQEKLEPKIRRMATERWNIRVTNTVVAPVVLTLRATFLAVGEQ